MVTLVRQKGAERSTTGTIALSEVAVHAKPMDDKYINAAGNFITDEFLEYMQPLVGPIPEYASLSHKKFNCA
jgi:hypothetical protein